MSYISKTTTHSNELFRGVLSISVPVLPPIASTGYWGFGIKPFEDQHGYSGSDSISHSSVMLICFFVT